MNNSLIPSEVNPKYNKDTEHKSILSIHPKTPKKTLQNTIIIHNINKEPTKSLVMCGEDEN